ncbi:hypothetical protein ACO22_03350 [Paracoccidioides brasiliensis]|uniref:Uncharacterized protein n=1 Tax=Paracoccidioides brasiliensis TaxID=121759 RepID=A0A1D2JG70_PARBR|nr:hypothetical protein ACO22_03350 [Paracoccidioides brasiliensis]
MVDGPRHLRHGSQPRPGGLVTNGPALNAQTSRPGFGNNNNNDDDDDGGGGGGLEHLHKPTNNPQAAGNALCGCDIMRALQASQDPCFIKMEGVKLYQSAFRRSILKRSCENFLEIAPWGNGVLLSDSVGNRSLSILKNNDEKGPVNERFNFTPCRK